MDQNKPIVLAIEEGETILVSAINQILSTGVSPYFVKMIFDKVQNQLNGLAMKEIAHVRANFEKQAAERKNGNTCEDNTDSSKGENCNSSESC